MLLTDHPEQRALLLADPEARLAGAVEEMVRQASPVMFMRRTLTRDYTMNGHDYHAGDKVALFYWSANYDETVFADPARFDITRSPNPHVGFGAAGPHFCLGAHPGPAGDQRRAPRAAGAGSRYSRRLGPPDRLLSSFINGIKHLNCDFSR